MLQFIQVSPSISTDFHSNTITSSIGIRPETFDAIVTQAGLFKLSGFYTTKERNAIVATVQEWVAKRTT